MKIAYWIVTGLFFFDDARGRGSGDFQFRRIRQYARSTGLSGAHRLRSGGHDCGNRRARSADDFLRAWKESLRVNFSVIICHNLETILRDSDYSFSHKRD